MLSDAEREFLVKVIQSGYQVDDAEAALAAECERLRIVARMSLDEQRQVERFLPDGSPRPTPAGRPEETVLGTLARVEESLKELRAFMAEV